MTRSSHFTDSLAARVYNVEPYNSLLNSTAQLLSLQCPTSIYSAPTWDEVWSEQKGMDPIIISSIRIIIVIVINAWFLRKSSAARLAFA